MGPWAGEDADGQRKFVVSPPEFEYRTVKPVAGPYIENAVPAPVISR